MDDAPKVQLFLQDRLLAEVPFSGDAVRIGRMRENDLVVNNLAVSRFHAVLRRSAGGFEVEDLGSENGTFVAGRRVRGTAPVGWEQPIGLGEHTVVLRRDGGEPVAPSDDAVRAAEQAEAAGPAGLDAPFDASEMDGAVSEAHLITDHEAAAEDMPDPEGTFAVDESELDDDPLVPDDGVLLAQPVSGDLGALDEPFTDPLGVSAALPGEHTALFDFGMSGDLAAASGRRAGAASPPEPPEPAETVLEVPALVAEDGESAEPAHEAAEAEEEPEEETVHAGIIVQRGGRLERVVPWEADELVAGRASDCGIVLPEAGVSRRHAAFVRVDGQHRVRDLGAVNKVYLNGQIVRDAELSVGDMVRLDEFELTFVLDSQPVGHGLRAPATIVTGDDGLTRVDEVLASQGTGPTRVDVLEGEEAAVADDEKPLEFTELPPAELPAMALAGAQAPLRLELELPAERLPAPVREALRALAEDELVVPAELRIRIR